MHIKLANCLLLDLTLWVLQGCHSELLLHWYMHFRCFMTYALLHQARRAKSTRNDRICCQLPYVLILRCLSDKRENIIVSSPMYDGHR